MQGRDLLSKWELNQLYWHEGSQVFPVCEMLKSLTYKNFVQTDGQIFSMCVTMASSRPPCSNGGGSEEQSWRSKGNQVSTRH